MLNPSWDQGFFQIPQVGPLRGIPSIKWQLSSVGYNIFTKVLL
jgi:hypothetical protein